MAGCSDVFSGVSVLTENMVPIYYETLAAGILFMIIPNPVKLFLGNLLSGIEKMFRYNIPMNMDRFMKRLTDYLCLAKLYHVFQGI